jgi:hypothetical protein
LFQVEVLALAVVLLSVYSIVVLGDVVPLPALDPEVPAWLKMAMDIVVGLPYVGPVVVFVLKWTGVVAAVMTGLSTLVMGVATALKAIGQGLGFQGFAQKVDELYHKVWPWVAWLSMYNVPKRVR